MRLLIPNSTILQLIGTSPISYSSEVEDNLLITCSHCMQLTVECLPLNNLYYSPDDRYSGTINRAANHRKDY